MPFNVKYKNTFMEIKKEPCLKGGKEKQKTQDEMWVFVASGSARQPHTSAFAFLTFLQVFLSAKVLWVIRFKF